MENKKVLEVKNLRKEYKEFTLDNVSLSLPEGYIMGIIGPNGAGKTTTIKLLMNMINPDGGEMSIFGLDPRKDERGQEPHRLRGRGAAFLPEQDGSLDRAFCLPIF